MRRDRPMQEAPQHDPKGNILRVLRHNKDGMRPGASCRHSLTPRGHHIRAASAFLLPTQNCALEYQLENEVDLLDVIYKGLLVSINISLLIVK